MKKPFKTIIAFFVLFLFFPGSFIQARQSRIILSCNEANDLYTIIKNNKLPHSRYASPEEALKNVQKGDVLLILANNYPDEQTKINEEFYQLIERKNIKAYIEYPSYIPDIYFEKTLKSKKERIVINTNLFKELDSLSILVSNGLHYLDIQSKINNPFVVAAQVAGFDSAIFGLPEKTVPLLFKLKDNKVIIAATSFSNFVSGRYAPQAQWGIFWKRILEELGISNKLNNLKWEPEISVTYQKNEKLPVDFQRKSIKKGIDWYKHAKMLVAESCSDSLQQLINSGTQRIEWNKNIALGDGSKGSLECIISDINENGSQPIGIIVRGDCVSETAMAFATSGSLFQDKESSMVAQNLLDYYLFNSIATRNEYGDPQHGAYGLIPWGISNHDWYKASYGDDNARFVISALITSSLLKTDRWDEKLMRSLLVLLRTTGTNGFRGERIDLANFEQNGWKYYFQRDIINLSPHFEAYLWACFLWAYNQTGDNLFLERAEKGIINLMENYPDKLRWTNGLAQEKARMLLPLSWLVKVKNTPENKKMLRIVVDDIIKLQDTSGAIREELGSIEMGRYPPPQSNEAYGTNEASLIAKNGDPVSDLLYTTNFAFLGLHEASYVLEDPEIKKAVDLLAEFLCRIQVKSDKHPEINGGWMRSFDYEKFEHWGSNADAGWGAWVIESGWTQGWITAVLALRELKTSVWNLTENSNIKVHYSKLKSEMFN
jgi:hypothetical protein